jgi:hypothetical protein
MRNFSTRMKEGLFVLLALLSYNLFSQGPEVNLEKYWRYRHRLNSKFLIQGTGRGEGFPFSSLKLSAPPSLSPDIFLGITGGDATLHNGFYIGMLATEWKLLHDQGLNTSETELALYYAIEAYNRLDYYANVLIGKQPDVGYGTVAGQNYLDGYIMREDFPQDFLFATNSNGWPVTLNGQRIYHERHKHLNQDIGIRYFEGFPAVNPCTPPLISYCSSTHTEDGVLRTSIPEYGTCNNTASVLNIEDRGNIMGLDQIIGMLIGFRLAVKYLPPNLNLPNKVFSDGRVNFIEEIQAITTRIFVHLYDNDFLVAHVPYLACDPYLDLVNRGGNVRIASGPLMMAIEDIGFVSPMNYNSMFNSLNSETWFISSRNLWNSPILQTIVSTFSSVFLHSHSEWMIAALMALAPSTVNPIIVTQANISLFEIHEQWCPFYSLLLLLLNPNVTGGLDSFQNLDVLNNLDAAPCNGPHRSAIGFCPDGIGASGWEFGNRFTSKGNENDEDQPGEFNFGFYPGLDYMLLFNLYCLRQPNYISQYTNKAWMNLNEYVPLSTPYHGQTGAGNNFLEYNAFDYIMTSQVLGQNANMSYQAGREIVFLPGFESSYGAQMMAHIEPLECEADGHYRQMEPSPSGSQSNQHSMASLQAYPAAEFRLPSSSDSIKEVSMQLFPNPGSQNATLEFEGLQEFSLQVHDLSGKLIFQKQYAQSNTSLSRMSIPSSEWGQGVYMVSCTSASGFRCYFRYIRSSD